MSKYELGGLPGIIIKDQLQEFLDDIDSRLTALEGGGSGATIPERVSRLEEIHKYRHTINGSTHDKGTNYPWANVRANKHYTDEEICKQLGII